MNTQAETSSTRTYSSAARSDQRMLVTIGLEDYFHVQAFSGVISPDHWNRFEKRIEISTQNTLNLLDQYGVKATFFVMGWVADQMPELIRNVSERGHEIANQGYFHKTIQGMSREEFRDDLLRSREALERASGRRIVGHRVPHFLSHSSLWALDVMAEEGVLYDSSLRPLMRQYSGHPFRRFIHEHHYGSHLLLEVPVSTSEVSGFFLPLAVGNGMRQFPLSWGHQAVQEWFERYHQPFVTYFHVWELDPEQPRISAVSWLTSIRQYRNLENMPHILGSYFEKYECFGIAEHLGLDVGPLPEGQDRKSVV